MPGSRRRRGGGQKDGGIVTWRCGWSVEPVGHAGVPTGGSVTGANLGRSLVWRGSAGSGLCWSERWECDDCAPRPYGEGMTPRSIIIIIIIIIIISTIIIIIIIINRHSQWQLT